MNKDTPVFGSGYSFSPTRSDAGAQDIFGYLMEAYKVSPEAQPDAISRAQTFIDWCRSHLSRVRPAETYPADMNIGIVFTDFSRCVVSPPVETGSLASGFHAVNVFGS